jgi:hypothetical protein
MSTGHDIDRRRFVGGAALAGASSFAPALVEAREAPPGVQLAQADRSPGPTPTSALTFKSVERTAGSTTRLAYAVKAGSFIFLNGHEAYDFERGLSSEVEGPPGHSLSGRPPLRREADYILRRMRANLKDFGSDLANAVRVDQFYTKGAAVSAYHLARFAEFGGYIPPSTSIIMERCFTARTNTHTSMIAVVPAPGWTIERSPSRARRSRRPATTPRSSPTISSLSRATWVIGRTARSIRPWPSRRRATGAARPRSVGKCTIASRSASSPR